MDDVFLNKFRIHLEAICPDWRRGRFLVAYSGGLDSTALLHLMARALPAEQVAAAHLNHSLRGQAAAADELFAQNTAEEMGLACFAATIDVGALARTRRKGIEEAARRARYDFLRKTALDWGADYIVTAHQADDQAETMLMNFIKGSGAGGLAGIHQMRPLIMDDFGRESLEGDASEPKLLRPLLPFTRSELRDWLVAGGWSWVEDLSNLDQNYLRNALRHDIMPRLKRLNPKLSPALSRASTVLRAEEDFWRAHLARLWPLVAAEESPELITLERYVLDSFMLAERRRLIYEGLSKIWRARPEPGEPLTFAGVETVIEMLKLPRHQGLDLPGGLRAELTSSELRLTPASRFLN